MKKLIDLIQEELVKAFTAAEMDPSYARVSVSNRPDLCEYQCNGAMAAAKAYHKAPIQLAEAVVEKVTDHSVIGEIEAVKPGFINLKINPEFLADYLSKMQNDEDLSVEHIVFNKELRKQLDIIIASLNPKEQKILKLRFGWDDNHPKTLEEIGTIYGVTRERIRQIEGKALRKLRQNTRSHRIKVFWED